MSAAEPYERLVALAEQELALTIEPELDPQALSDLLMERDALVAALPRRPPVAAAPSLARAAALQERITLELATRVAETKRTLGQVEHGRRTARGYGDQQPRPRRLRRRRLTLHTVSPLKYRTDRPMFSRDDPHGGGRPTFTDGRKGPSTR